MLPLLRSMQIAASGRHGLLPVINGKLTHGTLQEIGRIFGVQIGLFLEFVEPGMNAGTLNYVKQWTAGITVQKILMFLKINIL